MKKLTSYQKLKIESENKIFELHKDIHSLVMNDKDAYFIQMKYRMKIRIENAIMAGGTKL